MSPRGNEATLAHLVHSLLVLAGIILHLPFFFLARPTCIVSVAEAFLTSMACLTISHPFLMVIGRCCGPYLRGHPRQHSSFRCQQLRREASPRTDRLRRETPAHARGFKVHQFRQGKHQLSPAYTRCCRTAMRATVIGGPERPGLL